MVELYNQNNLPSVDGTPPLTASPQRHPSNGLNSSRWARNLHETGFSFSAAAFMGAPHHQSHLASPENQQHCASSQSEELRDRQNPLSSPQFAPNELSPESQFPTVFVSSRNSDRTAHRPRAGQSSDASLSTSTSPPAGIPRTPSRDTPNRHNQDISTSNFRLSRSRRGRDDKRYLRPQHRQPHNDTGRPSVFKDWQTWDDLTVELKCIPEYVDCQRLVELFSKWGKIVWAWIDVPGKNSGIGKVKFRPPPKEHFWGESTFFQTPEGGFFMPIALCHVSPRRTTPSPIRPSIMYPATMVSISTKKTDINQQTMNAYSMVFGILSESLKFVQRSLPESIEQHSVVFEVDLLKKWIEVTFTVNIPIVGKQRIHDAHTKQHETKVRLPLHDVRRIYRSDDHKSIHFYFALDCPPAFFRRTKWNEITEPLYQLGENVMWKRSTSIFSDGKGLQKLPAQLHEQATPVLDFGTLSSAYPTNNKGSWTSFQISFLKRGENSKTPGPRTLQRFEEEGLIQALSDHGIEIRDVSAIPTIVAEPVVWELIEAYPDIYKALQWATQLSNDNRISLRFGVHYQLEVCISNYYIRDTTITRSFLEKLAELDPRNAQRLLETISDNKMVLQDPMVIFDASFRRKCVPVRRLPRHCILSRTAIITPTTIHFQTPTVDTSNRVIRRYSEHAERFLRVRFADELARGRLYALPAGGMDDIYKRIKRILKRGIQVGNRHYKFLAFGNSQFREHGGYFFAETEHLKIDHIRAWMGNFENITNVAKHIARIGQCFSTTRAIKTPANIQSISDVIRNGYNFTDGVGKISPFLATMICNEFGIAGSSDNPIPSVFQFRLGGSKGVLVVSPDLKGRDVHLRPSQTKFIAPSQGLEIIRWSQYSAAALNRQLILCLSALGVPSQVFLQKLVVMLQTLRDAMNDSKLALEALEKYHDANQTSSTIAKLVQAGFMDTKEPFVTSLVHLWRSWIVKYVKEKAKIIVEDGAFVFGCTDESKTLRGHYDRPINANETYEQKVATLPEIFIQVPDRDNKGKYKVIEAVCVLARNPSLHPGDIRIVRAVDCPPLRHIRDAVVFPQTGERDIASMCSGGDLDGDDFIVIWDKALIPKEWNCSPMSSTPSTIEAAHQPVGVDQIIDFFGEYLKNDNLGMIAHNHLGFADQSASGIKTSFCLELARLHSKAVDYVKSGEPAECPQHLFPRKWPHFMEKRSKRPDQIYHSRSVLGQLYDQTQRVDFIPDIASRDDRLYYACQPSSKILRSAKEIKLDYDTSLRRIMNRYGVQTEHEIWTTFILSHSSLSKDYKLHEEVSEVSHNLKEEYRKQIIDTSGCGSNEELLPWVTAMYRVTADEARNFTFKLQKSNRQESLVPPFISFPWLYYDILCDIIRKDKWDHDLHKVALQETKGHEVRLQQRRRPKELVVVSLQNDDLGLSTLFTDNSNLNFPVEGLSLETDSTPTGQIEKSASVDSLVRSRSCSPLDTALNRDLDAFPPLM